MMASHNTGELLRGVAFFEGLPDTLLWHLAKAGEQRSFAVDELLFREGEARAFFAVVLDGSVAIERADTSNGQDGVPLRLATFGAGSVLAEGALLDTGPHGSSGRATRPTTVALFRTDALERVLADAPALHAALVSRAARVIAERLRGADAMLAGGRRGPGFGGATRREHDFLGERDVPDAALYGVQTLRAMENFPITGVPLADFPELIIALAQVKEAAARTNMNANEVIANRALELLGRARGEYDHVHPNEHVNLSQSTNDVYPTAVKIALHRSIASLKDAMAGLVGAFLRKGEAFAPHLKMGRTQLQDAVPMTLGQEFAAFAHTMQEDVERLYAGM